MEKRMSPYLNIPKHAPSRDFMVRQAVLNAIATRFPHTLATEGLRAAATALARNTDNPGVAGVVREWVGKEYSLLASRYSEAA